MEKINVEEQKEDNLVGPEPGDEEKYKYKEIIWFGLERIHFFIYMSQRTYAA